MAATTSQVEMDLLMEKGQMMKAMISKDNGETVVRSFRGEANDHREVGQVAVMEEVVMTVMTTMMKMRTTVTSSVK